MFWMSGVADGVEVFGIARRTADVLWRTTTGGLEQEGKSLYRRVVEPFFEFDHMVPAVAEVVEIMDRLGPCLLNDIGVSIGPLIAVCCQALPLSSDTPVAIAPSELVRLRRRSDRGWRDDCLAGLAIDVVGGFVGLG